MTDTSGLSVHVIDSVCGTAAQGIRVSLYYKENTNDEKYTFMVEDETNADGRVDQLAPEGTLAPGLYYYLWKQYFKLLIISPRYLQNPFSLLGIFFQAKHELFLSFL